MLARVKTMCIPHKYTSWGAGSNNSINRGETMLARNQFTNLAGVFNPVMVEYAQTIRNHDTRAGPQDAELMGNAPQWYIAITAPNSERSAAAHLVGRRFGVYLPEIEKRIPASRKRPARVERRSMFPGYLFLFVWDIEAHVRRIRACPGIINLMYNGDNPAIIPDLLIDRIQTQEFEQLRFVRPKRQRWRTCKLLDVEDDGSNNIVAIHSYSALHDIAKLDDRGRNSLLHKALGL